MGAQELPVPTLGPDTITLGGGIGCPGVWVGSVFSSVGPGLTLSCVGS